MRRFKTRDEIENDYEIEDIHESENGFTIYFSGYHKSDDWEYELKLYNGLSREEVIDEIENFLSLLKLEV